MSLNASIRERLRSKVRGRQVHIAACIVHMYRGSTFFFGGGGGGVNSRELSI